MYTCRDPYGLFPNRVLSRTVVPDLGIFIFSLLGIVPLHSP